MKKEFKVKDRIKRQPYPTDLLSKCLTGIITEIRDDNTATIALDDHGVCQVVPLDEIEHTTETWFETIEESYRVEPWEDWFPRWMEWNGK